MAALTHGTPTLHNEPNGSASVARGGSQLSLGSGQWRRVETITRTCEPSQSHPLEVMMDLEVRKPHLDLLALIARLLKLWGAHECAGTIAGFFVDVACNLSKRRTCACSLSSQTRHSLAGTRNSERGRVNGAVALNSRWFGQT